MDKFLDLVQLQQSLEKKRTCESAIHQERKTLKRIHLCISKHYTTDASFVKKFSRIQFMFFILLSIGSLAFIYFVGLPFWGSLFPDQINYVHFAMLMRILIIVTAVIAIGWQLFDVHDLKNAKLIKFWHSALFPIGVFIFVGFVTFIVSIFFTLLGVVITFSDLYEAKVNEAFNIAILLVVLGVSHVVISLLLISIFTPLIGWSTYINPSFIVLRRRLKKQYLKEKEDTSIQLDKHQMLVSQYEKEIAASTVLVDKYKQLDYVNDMIQIHEKNKDLPFRFALNQAILNTQIADYNVLLNAARQDGKKSIEDSIDRIKESEIRFRATVKVYNQEIEDNNMRLRYQHDQQVDEVIKYASKRKK